MIPFLVYPAILAASSVALLLSYNKKIEIKEFIAPQQTEERCPCPALNILANHGIIQRSGRGISKSELKTGLKGVFNISKPLTFILVEKTFKMLGNPEKLNLSMLSQHDLIEHDVSLTREDYNQNSDASNVNVDLVEDLVEFPAFKKKQNLNNLIKFKQERKKELELQDSQIHYTFKSRIFSSLEVGLLFQLYKGIKSTMSLSELKDLLILERLPSDWRRSEFPLGIIKLGPSFSLAYFKQ